MRVVTWPAVALVLLVPLAAAQPPPVDVQPAGPANGSLVGVSGTGHSKGLVALSGTNRSTGTVAVTGVGPAEGNLLAVAVVGNSTADRVAVAGIGDAQGGLCSGGAGVTLCAGAAVSVTGDATAAPRHKCMADPVLCLLAREVQAGVAVSGTEDAAAHTAAVSGLGRASGMVQLAICRTFVSPGFPCFDPVEPDWP